MLTNMLMKKGLFIKTDQKIVYENIDAGVSHGSIIKVVKGITADNEALLHLEQIGLFNKETRDFDYHHFVIRDDYHFIKDEQNIEKEFDKLFFESLNYSYKCLG